MSHAIAAALPAFLASLVEFVEALTVVLAVGATRGMRSALAGAAAATVTLAVLVALFGPALGRVPVRALQLVVGVLLLFFGMRWLRKAVLRYAGVIAFHDEDAIYAKQLRSLGGPAHPRKVLDGAGRRPQGLDAVGFAVACKAVALEGLEVIFIVIAVGAGATALLPAIVGATLAGVIVIVAGVVLAAPLARVPENLLKLCVGVMLSAFGTFWVGEGAGAAWPAEDLSLPLLVAGFAAAASIAYASALRPRRA
jgi:uncharacterized membrane protein